MPTYIPTSAQGIRYKGLCRVVSVKIVLDVKKLGQHYVLHVLPSRIHYRQDQRVMDGSHYKKCIIPLLAIDSVVGIPRPQRDVPDLCFLYQDALFFLRKVAQKILISRLHKGEETDIDRAAKRYVVPDAIYHSHVYPSTFINNQFPPIPSNFMYGNV